MTEEEILTNKVRITRLLMNSGKDNIEYLIDDMDVRGFFTAPCSSKYHLAEAGGLAQHSLNVYHTLLALRDALNAPINDDEVAIVALLHDLGKIGDHGKPLYVPNILVSGLQSSKNPYETNNELADEPHEIRSVIMAERYIYLSEKEETAILHHNGPFGCLDSTYGKHNYDSTEIAFLLHTADMYCCRFTEKEEQ